MSVTTTTYTSGGNSFLINIVNETSSANVIAAVETVLTNQGWSLYDTVNASVLGNPFTPIVTKVYRVLNADGVSYKYLIIRWDTIKLFFYTSCCESWNTSTHVATNESWTQAGGFAQGYDIVKSYIIVAATARHFMIWPFINNQPGLWTAVMEFERVAAEDIATAATTPYPCYAWTSSVMIGTNWGTSVGATSVAPSTVMFAFPRLADGTVGPQAAYYYAPVTNRGMFPPIYPQTTITITGDVNYGHLGSWYKGLVYRWDFTQPFAGSLTTASGTKFPASSFSVDHVGKYMPFGRAFNFGVTANFGRPGDTIVANVDITGGWPSGNVNSSTPAECLLLPMNGGWEGNIYNTPSSITNSASAHYGPGLYSYNTAYTSGYVPTKVIAIGDTLWSTDSGGVRTYSLSAMSGTSGYSTTITTTPTPVAGTVGNVFTDIVFDGQRTVYAAAASGIFKIDIYNSNVQYVSTPGTVANGCSYLGIDNKNVYASNRNANTAPSCVVLDRATFTISASNTFVHSGTLLTTVATYGTPVPDYQGNVFVTTQAGTTSALQTYLGLFNANTGIRTIQPNTPRGSAAAYGGDAWYYDYITNRCWLIWAQSAANTHNQQEYWPGNLVVNGTNLGLTYSVAGNTTTFSTSMQPGSIDYLGDLTIIPFRGMHVISPKRNTGSSNGSPTYFTTFIHPSIATGTTPSGKSIFGAQANQYNTNQYLLGSPWNCGCGLTTNGSSLYSAVYDSTNNRYYVIAINGIYQANRGDAVQTGRLLLRG